MTLTHFLLARIAEDEAAARMASDDSADWSEASVGVLDTGELHALGDRGISRHIARHDPARVLAECEAKRRIVEVLTHVAAQCPVDDWNPSDTALIEVLGVMAEVYADHPDFQDDWKP